MTRQAARWHTARRASPGYPTTCRCAPGEAIALAQQLLDSGRPFQAHEVLEASWKSAPPAERDLWQGLAQVAVGLTHAQRGNPRGAAALLRRGAAAVSGYLPGGDDAGGPYGIDVAGITRAAGGLADRIERDGLDRVTPGDLRLRLRAAARVGQAHP